MDDVDVEDVDVEEEGGPSAPPPVGEGSEDDRMPLDGPPTPTPTPTPMEEEEAFIVCRIQNCF